MATLPTFTPLMTAAGRAAAIAQNGLGLQLFITHIALGAGKYNPVDLGPQTALVDRREKTTVAAGGSTSSQVTVLGSFDSGFTGAAYDVGEIGFFAGDPDAGGVLVAVTSRAGQRFTIRDNAAGIYGAQFTISVGSAPSGSISVIVDPSASIAVGLLGNYVRRAGDAMTGPLVLPGNATLPLQAVPLQQITTLLGGQGVFAPSGAPKSFTIGGFIIQWFKSAFTDVPSGEPGFSGTLSYPEPFPTECFMVMPATQVSAGGLNNWNISIVGDPRQTDFDFQVEEWSNGVNPGTALFLAIGR